MAKGQKTKTAAAPAAQSREETEQLIERIGQIQRELQRQDADLGDEVAAVKRRAEERAAPLKSELEEARDRVQRWCESNREQLTRGGRTKTAEFTTGAISWRLRPPAVSVRGGVDAVIAYLKQSMGGQFIRTKEELDKEALRASPEVAVTIPGIRLGSAGEDFIVEPFNADLAEVA